MKVLHVPYGYAPDPVGGTEVYVQALCASLAVKGVESVVAAPGDSACSYVHGGVRVHRFVAHASITQEGMFSMRDHVAARGFAAVLDLEKPSLVHFHSFTSASGVLALDETRRRNIPAIATYHTATFTCMRAGTLMRWGSQVCDGEMRALRCTACFLNHHGLPRLLAPAAAWASVVSWPLAAVPCLSSSFRGGLSSWRLNRQRHEATRRWLGGMNRVVALCQWTRQLLLHNGLSEHRVSQVRHGLAETHLSAASVPFEPPSGPLRLAFLGRLDPLKGIEVLIEAMRLIPHLDMQLDIYTIVQPSRSTQEADLCQAVAADSRIRLCQPVDAAQIVPTLRQYHALLVPSRCLETGPLVVLEAFAACVPVIGSNLGGIAEWVTHERDGLLVQAGDVSAWAAALSRIHDDPTLLKRLREGIQTPRSMSEVASEMLAIYEEVIRNPA